MNAKAFACFAAGILLAEAPVPVVAGKDLKTVPGPISGTPQLRDPAPLLGATHMDAVLRRSARNGASVPCVAAPAGTVAIEDAVPAPAGWKAYQVLAAPGETVKARLRGDHTGWFIIRCVNRMGTLSQGMLQNMIPTGNPEASFINQGKEAVNVYFVVDTTVLLTGSEPFTLTITREPAKP
ncbi:hypothetical protein [Mesoterricola sediminis]|uniref:Uncharacterized protein n=1 Tax=Mesoterricola sediminis TaxID=2927980 RepID=A0AA48GZP4_9BACT|nr:hypothetical protein [Mesoterricola sediminis]BDU76997.1 hypothetical protein METESE_19550 [Mesoterricola sediminis]